MTRGRLLPVLILAAMAFPAPGTAQTFATDDPVLEAIWEEATERSHLYELGHHLMDVIGPRLTGSPGLDAAHDWIVETYREWGVDAENEQYGTWMSWERGPTHVNLTTPRVQTLEATQLAWSPGTEDWLEGPVVALPEAEGPEEFRAWLDEEVEGRFVLTSFPEPTCRPDRYWEEHASDETVERMQEERERKSEEWTQRIMAAGMHPAQLPQALEQAGALGVLSTNWSEGWGTIRVFSAGTRQVPSIAFSCEDYGLLYRLQANGHEPEIQVSAEAEFLGEVPTYNTIGRIEGTEYPDEYILLSAHLDTWDGATGATDNGTGTILMMEVMRILKEVYPDPKRTILVGHWGGEEQGLNGSAAYAEDNPAIMEGMHLVMNQDNGTGRITEIDTQGFLRAGEYFSRWLSQVPSEVSDEVDLIIPGMPDDARSDHASFVCHGVPSFRLGSHEWDYRDYTWHTNRDTFDKIVFDEKRQNAVLTAMLTYLAAEEPELMARDKRVLPAANAGEEEGEWPSCRDPLRQWPM